MLYMRSVFATGLMGLLAAAGCATSTPTSPTAEAQTAHKASEARAEQLTILYMADLHGQMEPHPELFWHGDAERIQTAGGIARVAAAVDQIRKEQNGNVIVLDAGDTIQGSAPAALTQGAAVVPPVNAVGFDAGIPGNWEVAYGTQVMRERARQMRHPLIAANVRDADSGERVFPPYLIKTVGGVRVAMIGYTDPDVPTRQPPDYSQGLTYDDEEVLPKIIETVREKEGADVVLLVSHIGLAKAVELSRRLPRVDFHLSGDTHERTYEPVEVNGNWVVEPGAFGSFLGR